MKIMIESVFLLMDSTFFLPFYRLNQKITDNIEHNHKNSFGLSKKKDFASNNGKIIRDLMCFTFFVLCKFSHQSKS